jgi:hypothetical protein
VVEECYEFLLAYAAQGFPNDQGSKSGGQVREFLRRAVEALTGLPEACAMAVKQEGLEPAKTNTWRSLRCSIATLATLLLPLNGSCSTRDQFPVG